MIQMELLLLFELLCLFKCRIPPAFQYFSTSNISFNLSFNSQIGIILLSCKLTCESFTSANNYFKRCFNIWFFTVVSAIVKENFIVCFFEYSHHCCETYEQLPY